MSRAKIRIGVAGLGRIGWGFHCRGLAHHRDFKLVAVADNEPTRRAEAESTLGCSPYADYDDMLDQASLQAVVIATPSHLHKHMALAAFRRGLHVLLEKPMATNYRDAQTIVRAAKRAEKMLTVYQPHRLAAYFQHLRHIIDSGKIGRAYWVRRGMFGYCRRNDWQSLRKFGGGMLNNYGAHALDQVLDLVGYDVKRVFGDLQLAASMGDADDVVKVVVETWEGNIGEADINQASVINPYDLMVWGTCGGIIYRGGQFQIRSFDPKQLPDKAVDAHLASADRRYPSDDIEFVDETVPVDGKYQIDVFKDFARAIRTGREPLVRPEQTLAVMRVMGQCRQSSGRIRDVKREG